MVLTVMNGVEVDGSFAGQLMVSENGREESMSTETVDGRRMWCIAERLQTLFWFKRRWNVR